MREACRHDRAADCALCPVRSRTEWNALALSDLEELSHVVHRREYRSGETIYQMGAPSAGVYCISGGSVAMRKLDEQGNSVLLYLAYSGDTIGYRSFLRGTEHKTTAEALGPTVVCFVDGRAVTALIDRRPALALEFLRRATREVDDAHEALVKNVTMCNRARFVHLLLILMKRHGESAMNGARQIELPLSRRDIASMIGARHETLSRIIAKLEAEGLARFSGRHVVVPCVEALVQDLDAHLPA